MSTEVWKPVCGYEGKYEVSDHGQVRSLDRLDTAGRPVRGRIMKASTGSSGYKQVDLSGTGGAATKHVHRLVLEAFVGACPDGMEACHGDGGAVDNRLANLRWDSRSENMIDRTRHGTDRNVAKQSCARGHDLMPSNLVPSQRRKGWRSCLACNRALAWARHHPEADIQESADKYFAQIARTVIAPHLAA